MFSVTCFKILLVSIISHLAINSLEIGSAILICLVVC
jgi:hypothetical protein